MASIAVITAVKARIAGAGLSTPVRYPNEASTPPEDSSAFVEVQYPLADERQASIGSPGANVHRETGVIRFVVMVQAGTGIDGAATIAEPLRTLFRGARFDGVRCYAPTTLAFDDRLVEGRYCRGSMAVPYDRDILA